MKKNAIEYLRQARAEGLTVLDEPTGKRILADAGISVPRSVIVDSQGDLRAAADALKAPYVLKVVASGVVHKSDVGGVRLNLADADALATAGHEVSALMRTQGIEPQSWLVEELAPPGVEIVIGGAMDPEFGPMVMVGLGGIFVEVMRDVSFRICPICELDALEMIEELKGAPILRGARGSQTVSIEAIAQVLLCIGGEGGVLMACEQELAEVDINPLIVSKEGAVAVDARFILR
jgi:acetyl-CoA synthetase (ADP-forming)